MRSGWLSWVWLSAALVTAACSQPNPAVCCTSPADCGSLGIMETSRPCNDNFVCIDHGCTTAPPVDAGPQPPECSVDMDCPAAHPYCSAAQTCVDCTSSSQCEANAPVCDATSMECRKCAADSECDSNVCDQDVGTCTSPDLVLYASPTGPASGTCTQQTLCNLDYAISLADANRFLVRMTGTPYSGNPAIVGKRVILDGSGATLNAPGTDRAISIGAGANVRVIGLKIVNLAAGSGIGCEPGSGTATLSLSQVSMDANGTAVTANPCVVTIDRSSFHVHTLNVGAIVGTGPSTVTITHSLIDGGDGVQALNNPSVITISNSILINQTGADGALTGGTFSFGTPPPPGAIYASFTTIVNSKIVCGSGTPKCAGGAANGACLDNSIIIGPVGQDVVNGSACNVNFSIVMPQSAALTGANDRVNVDPLFKDGPDGDYSLTASSPAIDTANPNADVPSDDFVGTLRPQGPRADVGAYEYKP